MTISVAVASRIARAEGSPQLVCGNSGDTVTFSFDAEWDAYQDKTAYFCCIRDGTPQIVSVDFSGSSCGIPVIQAADFVEIGVTAGSIRTTTPARIPCLRCVTDIPSDAYSPPRDIYNELMETLQDALHPRPSLPAGYCFVVAAEGDYIVDSDGSYMIAKEE